MNNIFDLEKFLNSCEDDVEITDVNDNLIRIEWSLKGVGFGQLDFYKKDGKWVIDSETMGREVVKKILNMLVYNTEIVG